MLQKRRALTLPELMLSTLMISIIIITLSLALSSAYPAIDQIMVRIQLEQRCRLTLERVIPCLTAAVPASQQAIYEPATGTHRSYVRYCSNQDFLRVPPTPFDPRGIPPGPYHEYRLEQSGSTVVLSEIATSPPTPQVLARDVTISFFRDSENSLKVTVNATASVRNARRQTVQKSWALGTVVSLPAYAR